MRRHVKPSAGTSRWPGEILCERFCCDLEASPFGDAIDAKDGYLTVPQAPGLGVPVDHAVIERYRRG